MSKLGKIKFIKTDTYYITTYDYDDDMTAIAIGIYKKLSNNVELVDAGYSPLSFSIYESIIADLSFMYKTKEFNLSDIIHTVKYAIDYHRQRRLLYNLQNCGEGGFLLRYDKNVTTSYDDNLGYYIYSYSHKRVACIRGSKKNMHNFIHNTMYYVFKDLVYCGCGAYSEDVSQHVFDSEHEAKNYVATLPETSNPTFVVI